MINQTSKKSKRQGRILRWGVLLAFIATTLTAALWLRASIIEWRYGR